MELEKAIFAGGCFWCMEAPFEKLEGVSEAISGYCGGKEENPTYEDVAHGLTGHAESVLVLFNPKIISYQNLLDVYWKNINPVQTDGQFYDRGKHYRTVIFYLNEEQNILALKSKKELQNSGKFSEKIVVEISQATKFWPAEDYHQNYYKTNSKHYEQYKIGSGRDAYLKNTWK